MLSGVFICVLCTVQHRQVNASRRTNVLQGRGLVADVSAVVSPLVDLHPVAVDGEFQGSSTGGNLEAPDGSCSVLRHGLTSTHPT